MPETWTYLILPAAGLFIGAVAAMTGVGGGIFIVPLLTGLFGFVPQHAVGTSLMTIMFTAAAAAYSYSKQKRIFFRTGLLLAVTTVPGAFAGAYLTTVVSASLLGLVFGVFLFGISLQMILKSGGGGPVSPESGGASSSPPAVADALVMKSPSKLALGLGLSFFGGLASGFLGIGGGVLGVPIMTLGMGIPIHFATATSMFTMILTSISGVSRHALAHHVHVLPALFLAAGTVIGARAGAGFSKRVSARTLRRFFGLVLLAVSLQMIARFVRVF